MSASYESSKTGRSTTFPATLALVMDQPLDETDLEENKVVFKQVMHLLLGTGHPHLVYIYEFLAEHDV